MDEADFETRANQIRFNSLSIMGNLLLAGIGLIAFGQLFDFFELPTTEVAVADAVMQPNDQALISI